MPRPRVDSRQRVLAPLLAALTLASCPHAASLGHLTYVRGTTAHVLSFATCADRAAGHARPAPPPVRGVSVRVRHRRGARYGTQSIVVDGRVVRTVREDFRGAPAGKPGPVVVRSRSTDGRWVLFSIDPYGSASIAADGLLVQALDVRTGRVRPLAVVLGDAGELAWCGRTIVLAAGGDRIATHHKRLLAATPPGWRLRPLWRDSDRAFGSPACAPDGRSVAVLSQRDSTNADFFSTRWQLWRVALDGSRTLLDAPPAGWADESPLWSPRGDALLFVRERRGTGRAMLLRQGILFGPVANLGYSLGYYGHHDWWLGATWHE
jgi:hypothetical protein